MELRHLAGFIAVAEELHFGRAAISLHIAQPALSQQVRQLERELEVKLFERTTRSVRLTSSGEALLEPARRVMTQVELARQAARAGGVGEVGRVRIGFTGATTYASLPSLTREVREHHPGITLDLHGALYSGEVISGLVAGELDVGFVRLPVKHVGISTRVVEIEELFIALPEHHHLAGRKRIPLAALAGQPFTMFAGTRGSAVRDASVRLCLEAGFSPRIVQEAPDSHTLLSLVGAGVGVTLIVSSIRHLRVNGVAYAQIAGPTPRLSLALAWRTDDDSPALRAVLEIARRALPTPDRSSRRSTRT